MQEVHMTKKKAWVTLLVFIGLCSAPPSFAQKVSLVILAPESVSAADKVFEGKLYKELVSAFLKGETFSPVYDEESLSKTKPTAAPSISLTSSYFISEGRFYFAARLVDSRTLEILAGFSTEDKKQNTQNVSSSAALTLSERFLKRLLLAFSKTGSKSVAVMGFDGPSAEVLTMASEVFTSDLAQCPKFRLLERMHLDQVAGLYKKFGFEHGEFEHGEIVGADQILVGSAYQKENERVIQTRILEVKDGKMIGARKVSFPSQNPLDFISMAETASNEICEGYKY